ncbi:MAG: Smr/MutS family protein [Pyrinomonadaceae bacterium]
MTDEIVSKHSNEEVFDLEISDVLDLHSFRPEDTSAVVTAYLDEARNKRYTVVRIVHGIGIGVKREIVRSVLSQSNLVKAFKNAPEFSGSRGSTIVELLL